MKAKIKLDTKRAIDVDTSLNWLWIYRQQFGRDILPDLLPAIEAGWKIVGATLEKAQSAKLNTGTVIEAAFDPDVTNEIFTSLYGLELTTFLQVVWAMAKNADDSVPLSADAWLKSFDSFPLDAVIPQTVNLITKSCISSKNLKRLQAITKKVTP